MRQFTYYTPTEEQLNTPHKFLILNSIYDDCMETSMDNYVGLVDTEEEAIAYCKEKYEYYERVEELAIKDAYNDMYYDYTNTSDDRYPYSSLEHEYRVWLAETYIPDADPDEWTEEEETIMCDVDTAEEFKKYMVEKAGLTEEVANATIEYNGYDSDHKSPDNNYNYVLVPIL